MSDEKYLTLAEVKEILDAEREIRDLNTEQLYALTHAERFAKLSAKDARKLVEELIEIGGSGGFWRGRVLAGAGGFEIFCKFLEIYSAECLIQGRP